MIIRDLDTLLFFFHWLNEPTYMCAHLGDLNVRKNLSLEIPAGPEIRPIRSSVIRRAYHETTRARAFARVLRRTGRGTKNERLIVPKETADSFKIPRWLCWTFCKATSCGRERTTVCGPDKLSDLEQLGKAASLSLEAGSKSGYLKNYALSLSLVDLPPFCVEEI